MKKINIAEILKDCPKGMELYSPIFGEVYLDKVRPHLAIVVTTDKEQGDSKEEFLYDGRYGMNGECMLFPSKGKTTWDGFQRPFRDGDIAVSSLGGIHIMQNPTTSYCYFDRLGILDRKKTNYVRVERLATEEEKQKLFDAIKANGYRWNQDNKTLEKLIEPEFKAGDKIEKCGYRFTIKEVKGDYYLTKCGNKIPIDNQDDFSLVPNKFDITTLKPFDKVLVRGDVGQKWTHDFFGFMDKDKGYPFVCVGHYVIQCIPYEGNEHLLGKTDDCEEYFKTWK